MLDRRMHSLGERGAARCFVLSPCYTCCGEHPSWRYEHQQVTYAHVVEGAVGVHHGILEEPIFVDLRTRERGHGLDMPDTCGDAAKGAVEEHTNAVVS